MEELKEHLKNNKSKLVGDWIKNNSSYDRYICDILNMTENTVRYWDATWNEHYIEFKKGNSIWLDLVRYSEILLKINSDASRETTTLFFIPNNTKEIIEEIICVKTIDLIKFVNLTEDVSKQLISLNKNVPRSLNAQTSLTKKDIKKISIFII